MGACGSKDDDVPERSSRSGVSRSTLNLGSSDVSTLGSLPSKDATGSEDNGPVVAVTEIYKLATERQALMTVSGRGIPNNTLFEMFKKRNEEELQDKIRRSSAPDKAPEFLKKKKTYVEGPTNIVGQGLSSTAGTKGRMSDVSELSGSAKAKALKVINDNSAQLGSTNVKRPMQKMKSGGLHEAYANQLGEVTHEGQKTFLPRGGILVRTETKEGIDIQFGVPPETIKDSMNLGFSVPQYFVISHEMFDRVGGTSLAEFEFPAYFNFFVLKRKVTIICRSGLAKSIRAIFQETLIGPRVQDYRFDKDFPEGSAPGDFPNFEGEGCYLDPARKTLKISDLLKVVEFDEVTGIAKIGEGDSSVRIKLDGAKNHYQVSKINLISGKKEIVAMIPEDVRRYKIDNSISKLEYQPLTIPEFGVTVLGASHGFDPAGTTTGFVVWVNGKGMVVDPPPGSNDVLKKLSIPNRAIDGIILTHCHADHDAGTFQRILSQQNVKLYTTQTILDSFIRKYSAVTGLDPSFLKGLFTHVPCTIGQPIPFNGANFKVFYSMHTIPCIGFECFYNKASIIYSADTNSDPELPIKMFEDGIIGAGRRNALENNALKGKHSIIFHEAGVPPIHTPMGMLANQPYNVKERMYLVHVSENKVPKDKGLKVATEWSTMVLQQPLDFDEKEKKGIKQALNNTELFENVENEPFEKYIYGNVEKVMLPRGHVIFNQNEEMDHMYYVLAGQISAMRDCQEEGGTPPHQFTSGDLIGQEFLVHEGRYSAFTAKTNTTAILYKISLEAASKVIEPESAIMLKNLANLMKSRTWDALASNILFHDFTMTQKVDFFNILSEERELKPDIEIDCENSGCLVVEGTVHVLMDATAEEGEDLVKLKEEIGGGSSKYEEEVGAGGPGGEACGEAYESNGSSAYQSNGSNSSTNRSISGSARYSSGRVKRSSSRLKSTGSKGSFGSERDTNVDVIKRELPGFMNNTIDLLAQTWSQRSIELNTGSQKTTFRGQHLRSTYVEEEGGAGMMVLDINSIILKDQSLIQVETITHARVRMLERDAVIAFMKKYPGILVKVLDSFLSTGEKTVC